MRRVVDHRYDKLCEMFFKQVKLIKPDFKPFSATGNEKGLNYPPLEIEFAGKKYKLRLDHDISHARPRIGGIKKVKYR